MLHEPSAAAPPARPDARPLEIDGLRLDAIGLHEVLARVERACDTRSPLHVVTVNVGHLSLARGDDALRRAINAAGLAIVDGRLLLWLARLRGTPSPEQVTGHDLVREGLALAARRGWRVFLLGGAPGVAASLARTLERERPGLRAEGAEGGRFTDDGRCDGDAEILARIRAFAPHLLFVALGAPKQELWLARNLQASGALVGAGVGGVFDTLAGTLGRAPRWMQVAGLESPYQLAVAPRRFARRYLLRDPPTLLRVAAAVTASRLRELRGSRAPRGLGERPGAERAERCPR